MTFEEHWTAPAAGGMMGMFRLLANDKVLVYEYLMLEQESDGTYMRLRHYRPGMVDVDPAPVRCRLTEATPQKLIFENPDGDKPKRISYVLNDQQLLTVTVETTRDGKPAMFTLRFQMRNQGVDCYQVRSVHTPRPLTIPIGCETMPLWLAAGHCPKL